MISVVLDTNSLWCYANDSIITCRSMLDTTSADDLMSSSVTQTDIQKQYGRKHVAKHSKHYHMHKSESSFFLVINLELPIKLFEIKLKSVIY